MRAQKAFKDANKLYAASDWRAAAAKYEEALVLFPENAYSYFFLANSLDNLYRPTRVGEPENDALLTRAIENYKLAAPEHPGPAVEAALVRVPGRRLRPRQAQRPDAWPSRSSSR